MRRFELDEGGELWRETQRERTPLMEVEDCEAYGNVGQAWVSGFALRGEESGMGRLSSIDGNV